MTIDFTGGFPEGGHLVPDFTSGFLDWGHRTLDFIGWFPNEGRMAPHLIEITTLTRSPWLMRWGFGRRDISVSWTSYRWFKILYSHKPMHYNGTEINVMFIRLPTPNLNWFIPWWRSHNPRFSCITFLFVYLCQRWVLLSVVCLFVQTYLIDIFTFVWCD
jgi:hypothetical protein